MLGISSFPLFVGAVVLLNLTPGPDMAYVAGQSIAHGRQAGIVSALGIALGGGLHTLACAFGLSALIAASPKLFDAIRWAGAAYLIYLGLKTLWPARAQAASSPTRPCAGQAPRSLMLRGFVSNISNPKVFLFYIAFLPQFVDAQSPRRAAGLLVLGMVLVVLSLVSDCAVACGAATLAGSVRKRLAIDKWLKRVVGASLIGLGVRLAATTR